MDENLIGVEVCELCKRVPGMLIRGRAQFLHILSVFFFCLLFAAAVKGFHNRFSVGPLADLASQAVIIFTVYCTVGLFCHN